MTLTKLTYHQANALVSALKALDVPDLVIWPDDKGVHVDVPDAKVLELTQRLTIAANTPVRAALLKAIERATPKDCQHCDGLDGPAVARVKVLDYDRTTYVVNVCKQCVLDLADDIVLTYRSGPK